MSSAAEVLYPEINKCIYCGATRYASDSNRFLAPEHIIPFGLNGNLVLPRASCRACERITGRVEALVLRGSLLGCRNYLGLRTRSPKDRPKALPLFDASVTPNRKVMVAIEDYPISLLLMQMEPPAILTGRPANIGHNGAWIKMFKCDMPLLRSKYNLKNVATSSLDAFSFNRMLAKIAYSFAIGECAFGRLGHFTPYLLKQILEEGEDADRFMYIGCQPSEPGDSKNLHEIEIEEPIVGHERLVSVKIRLFSNFGTPVYRVVVGERIA